MAWILKWKKDHNIGKCHKEGRKITAKIISSVKLVLKMMNIGMSVLWYDLGFHGCLFKMDSLRSKKNLAEIKPYKLSEMY